MLFALISCSQQESDFSVLESSKTNLTFSNEINVSQEFSLLDYMYFFNGAGVAIGDIDNDGLEDIFFSGNLVSSELYLNTGNLKFKSITLEAGVETNVWCTGVLMEDFNQDGWLDIYVAVAGSPDSTQRRNLLFINNRDLTFSEKAVEYGLAFQGYSTHAAVLDYDMDGDLDLYLLNHTNQFNNVNDPVPRKLNGQAANTDRLLRNDQTDSIDHPVFTDVSTSAGITIEGFGLGVGVADLNNDGWPDIYVSNDFISNDLLYINQKDGTFENVVAQAIRHQSFNAMGNDLADFNNDGLTDIMVVDMLPETRERKMLMAGNVTLNLQLISDLTGYERQYPRNTMQLNQAGSGSGVRFSEIGQQLGIESTDWSWSPLLVDFDADGAKDLFVTNGYLRDITNLDFISYRRRRSVFKTKESIDSAYIELVKKLPEVTLPNRYFRNTKNWSFAKTTENFPNTISTGAAVSDLNNDGHLSLVTSNINRGADLYTSSHQNNWLKVNFTGSESNKRGIGAKVTAHVGQEALTFEHYLSRGYMSTSGAGVTIGLGENEVVDSLIVLWPDQKSISKLYSVAANQEVTVGFGKSNAIDRQSLEMDEVLFSEFTIQKEISHAENPHVDFRNFNLLPWSYSNGGPAVVVGDVNGDRRQDFYVVGAKDSSGVLAIYQNGTFETSPTGTPKETEEMDAVFLDIDSDNDLDLYIVSGGSENYYLPDLYQDRVLLNDGYGQFQEDTTRIPVTTSSGSKAVAFDYDKDGDLDIFRGGYVEIGKYGKTPESYLLENKDGRLVKAPGGKELSHLGMITDVLNVDFDGDGWEDLVVVGEWMEVTLCRNQGDGSFLVKRLGGTSGIWRSVASGDFDMDGDMDFIVGNLGLNTGLNASSKEPLTLIGGLLDNNASYDAIISEYEDSKLEGRQLFPLPKRGALLGQMPGLQNEFPNYASYAGTTTNDLENMITGEIELRKECQMLASIFLRNEGDGAFVTEPLFAQAQFSTIEAILVDDFNQDGYPDFVAGGNNSGMNVDIGNADASYGVLAFGNGDGSFRLVAPQLGNFFEGEIRDLEQIEIESERHIIVGKNNSALRIIKLNNRSNE